MLVITVKQGETVKVGDTVLHVLSRSGVVRLGFEAPQDVKILRENAKKKTR